MKTVSEDSASAAELETPHSLDEAMETGFLPDDPHYRLTGEFKSEKTDASAAAKKDDKENQSENEEASATSSPADTAAASAAAQAAEEEKNGKGRAQSKTAHTSENRWQKRERELKELREENTRLKSQSSRTETRSDSKQTSQPATETTAAKAAPKPKIDDVDPKTGKAKFANYTEYEDAKDAWLQDSAVRQFQETQSKTQQLTEQQRTEREIGQNLQKKFEPLRAKYADFDKVALNENLTIPKGSVTELFLLDSDHAGEVLYHLGQHPDILQGFYANHDPKTGKFQSLITPQRQFRKLMEIEASLSGGSGSGASDEKNSSSSSAKPVTQASRPPHQVSGKGTVAKDAVEQAVDDADTETYIRAQNAKELAHLRRK